ncbi:hypothetical protein BZL29_8446 [Mycobacterium kansasii]|uniref:Uncharacterized protein n=1 Tax=Mycobacterium kansasii TaxID=1768 RepID=A0A1V3WAJ8_MYCKA|nr:hypothetical protein BZL29_8446 [Mycobacterium kansasii]
MAVVAGHLKYVANRSELNQFSTQGRTAPPRRQSYHGA